MSFLYICIGCLIGCFAGWFLRKKLEGHLFLRTGCKLVKYSPITMDDIKAAIKQRQSYDFNLSHLRKHCYEDGFIDGAKWGSYKLLLENKMDEGNNG